MDQTEDQQKRARRDSRDPGWPVPHTKYTRSWNLRCRGCRAHAITASGIHQALFASAPYQRRPHRPLNNRPRKPCYNSCPHTPRGSCSLAVRNAYARMLGFHRPHHTPGADHTRTLGAKRHRLCSINQSPSQVLSINGKATSDMTSFHAHTRTLITSASEKQPALIAPSCNPL